MNNPVRDALMRTFEKARGKTPEKTADSRRDERLDISTAEGMEEMRRRMMKAGMLPSRYEPYFGPRIK
jgi:hypothetical protein